MCKKYSKGEKSENEKFCHFFSSKTIVIFCQKISLVVFVLKRHKFCVTSTSSAHNLHAHKKDDDDDEEEEEDQGF